MPYRAKPGEFYLSEYQASRCRFLSLACVPAYLAAFLFDLALGDGGVPFGWLSCLSAFQGVAAFLVGHTLWLRAGRPFARLSRNGLTLHDGLLRPWSASWAGVRALEAPDRHHADLSLAGRHSRHVPLIMFEPEDRRVFVEAVQKWIRLSH